jgi:hypothetical protein
MNETNTVVKSEKISQKKKIKLVWIVATLFVIIYIISFVVDYSNYKKGQTFGISSAALANMVDQNDSYEEQCKKLYEKLNSKYMIPNGKGIKMEYDYNLLSNFSKLMNSAGYDRHMPVTDWFKYNTFIEYFFGYFYNRIISICLYLVVIFSIVFTIITSREAKKEIVVYEDSVLYRYNPKKSNQLVFQDINNVDFGKKSLKIIGVGTKFKISNISNAEEIKSAIIAKKKTSHDQSMNVNTVTNASSADELKKYKELLDSGVITQEEFDAKKKQLLEL